jgi:hypothetical protein
LKSHIVDKYGKQIEDGDLTFFMDKDYSNDISGNEKIMEGINRLREPIKNMTKENQDKSMKYIQNLTKLCLIYHE